MSLPAWGEWIEIKNRRRHCDVFWSLPAWGEWIEIAGNYTHLSGEHLSLPAWGEWIEISQLKEWGDKLQVSPRMGRVD